MHPVTHRFTDAALEAAYHDQNARSTLPAFRLLCAIGLVAMAAMLAVVDRRLVETDANLAALRPARLAVVALAALGFAFTYAPAPMFRRWWLDVGTLCGAAALLLPLIGCFLLPDPARLDLVSAMGGEMALLVVVCVVVPIGVVRALVVNLVVTATLVVFVARWPAYHGDAAIWLALASVLVAAASYQVSLRDRRGFAAQYRLDEERARSERLLRNVLPGPVAERLKAGEAPIADRFEHATVLFADLVGFTPLAARLAPEALVAALDHVFSAFDDIAARHGLEKIKTIGDAYMVVGGVPTPRADHADAVARMALEMRDVIAATSFAGGDRVEVRIGLHSGPVVAGVIGKQKFIYDLWGDTVNTASRMEASGVPGGIQVTATTEALLRDRFTLTPRGTIAVKGKGDLATWLLVG